MMKKLSFIVLLVKFTFAHAQVTDHLLFKVTEFAKTEDVSSFKLRYTDVTLLNKQASHKKLHIFNMYFSCEKPLGGAFNKSRYSVGTLKYNELSNDFLVTLTPLTDSLESKLIKINKSEAPLSEVYTAQQLFDDAVKRLYNEFTRSDISNQNITPSNLKTMKFKLIVQKGEDYYKYDGPVLTEFYLIDRANYLFPSQYHFDEINVIGNNVPFITRKDISDLDKKLPSTTQNSESPREALFARTYPSKTDSTKRLKYTEYNTYSGKPIDEWFNWRQSIINPYASGAGTFAFVYKLGIVNGSYNFFVRNFKNAIEAENDNGRSLSTLNYSISKINKLSVDEFVKIYRIAYPQIVTEKL